MSLRRLRAGELIALLGAGLAIASLVLPWYETPSGNLDAWETFGVAVALIVLATVFALALVLATLAERSTAIPMATVVWTVLAGMAGLVAALIRVLERPDHATGLCAAPWLALAGVAAILVGAWQAMRDERTSAYEPPPVERRPPPEGSE
ncbi:MAG: hypothetical protein KGJ43_00655 [Acidobacteriota bacterium]|nr:hypothetical protein [Acidobacteriota bacterium]